ncbi:hypothetical protein ACL03H_16425 [Saccharopolyspora sp. MS10]|uniref:hypothetical protein n=1 Tax=Saccharopolyspora sp. MS10 TaxID=3385973 RepID=UPI0039A2FCB0
MRATQLVWLAGVAVPVGFFLVALISDPVPMVVAFSIPVFLHAALVVPPAIMLGTGANWARVVLVVLGAINLVSTFVGGLTVMVGWLLPLPLVFAATIVLLELDSTRRFCGARPRRRS